MCFDSKYKGVRFAHLSEEEFKRTKTIVSLQYKRDVTTFYKHNFHLYLLLMDIIEAWALFERLYNASWLGKA